VFLGYVDEKTKIGALDASIALVLPSICNYVEVFSIVISEAWARNKPVIATAVGEIPYRVKHMINGLLIPPKNPQKLAEAIITLLNDENLRTKLGTEGRRNILTWSEIATKIISIYKYDLTFIDAELEEYLRISSFKDLVSIVLKKPAKLNI